MDQLVDFLLVIVMVLGIATLGFSRISGCIRLAAAQGIVLGILVLLVHFDEINIRLIALALLSIFLKGVIFPWLLYRSMREAGIQREVEPFIGFIISILLGTLGLLAAFALGDRLPLPIEAGSSLIVPVSLGTLFAGLLLIVTRKKAVMQVVGYLVLENGIFTFSLVLVSEMPAVVELGVLLDLFVAVFVMGITIYHISHEFDDLDVTRLSQLQDVAEAESTNPQAVGPHEDGLE